MLGVPSAAVRVQPVRSMVRAVVLRSSIHSSLDVSGVKPGSAAKVGADVPAQAISESTTSRTTAVSRTCMAQVRHLGWPAANATASGLAVVATAGRQLGVGHVQQHQVVDRRGQRLEQEVADGLAIFWLAQAGFVYKTPGGTIIYVDAYLSDCVHRMLSDVLYGFKRIMPAPPAPEEIEADVVVCTHSHPDHFDYDAIPVLARNARIRFVAAPDCRVELEKLDIPEDRYTIIHEGETLTYGDVSLTGVYADHGDLAPEALGVLLQSGDIKVWQVADTAYRPDKWQDIFAAGVDVIMPPMNGAGTATWTAPRRRPWRTTPTHRVTIPCHFWMFAEHSSSPGAIPGRLQRARA